MSSTESGGRRPSSSTEWRLRSLEARVSRLEEIKPDVIADRVAGQAQDINELRNEVRSLKRALYTFALSISASAIAFAIAVMNVIR